MKKHYILTLICISTIICTTNAQSTFIDICKSGTPEQMEQAFLKGASLLDRNEYGWTPLIVASAFNPNPEIIDILIRNGADINETVPTWLLDLSFVYLQNYRSFDDVKKGISGTIYSNDKTGANALMFACYHNQKFEVVKKLISSGLSSNTLSISGRTPFLYSSSNQNHDIIKLLIEYGADVNVKDDRGYNLLQNIAIAYSENYPIEIFQWLLDAGSDTENVLQSVAGAYKDPEVFLLVYKYVKTDDNIKEQLDKSLFGSALEGRSPGMVKAIIDAGADVNTITKDGTPLSVTIQFSRSIEICKLLIENGADVNQTIYDGKTPLIVATIHKDWELVYMLIEAGADIDTTDDTGKNARDYALEHGVRL